MEIGLLPLISYITGSLTLNEAVKALSKKTGVNMIPVILDDPHAGIDVDKPEDYRLVNKIINDN